MRELTAEEVCKLVAEWAGASTEAFHARELGGGVSNRVWMVESAGERLVIKQALPKLRVQEEWLSDPSRIHREAASLRRLQAVLKPGCVPAVLFERQDLYIYAMQAAPADCTWKDLLLKGDVDPAIAIRIAQMQSAIMNATWDSVEDAKCFGDLTAFDQLRIDPYYRFTASRHALYAQWFDRAIRRATHETRCLVHGDWSPKNMMVHEGNVTAIDFEVIHFGDPAFDCGFLLNHLILKSIHRPESIGDYRRAAQAYWETIVSSSPADPEWLREGTILHLGALLLARVDGKSPAEYLKEDAKRDRARALALSIMDAPPDSVDQVFSRLAQ